jgi:hypothetical protein
MGYQSYFLCYPSHRVLHLLPVSTSLARISTVLPILNFSQAHILTFSVPFALASSYFLYLSSRWFSSLIPLSTLHWYSSLLPVSPFLLHGLILTSCDTFSLHGFLFTSLSSFSLVLFLTSISNLFIGFSSFLKTFLISSHPHFCFNLVVGSHPYFLSRFSHRFSSLLSVSSFPQVLILTLCLVLLSSHLCFLAVSSFS